MNRAAIEARFKEYEAMKQQCGVVISEAQALIAQKSADLNAIEGAMQDCQYWLGKCVQMAVPEAEAAVIAGIVNGDGFEDLTKMQEVPANDATINENNNQEKDNG